MSMWRAITGAGHRRRNHFWMRLRRHMRISCGQRNSYGHPTAEVLQRLQGRGIEMYRTDLQGTVILYSDGSFIWSDQDPCQDWTPGASDGQTRAMPENDGTGQESHQASEESADEIQYVCNTNTKKFHYLSCDSVNQMNESNRMNTTLSRDELIAQGRCVLVARV